MVKKKLAALMLTFAMTVGLVQGVFAAEKKLEETMEEQIQAEIEERTKEVYKLVYEQLEAQNAVKMIDVFMDIYVPEIELEVLQKYYGDFTLYSTNESRQFVFNYGGIVAYETLDGREIVETYFDQEDTRTYIKNTYSLTVYDIIMTIFSCIPVTATYVGPICAIQTIVDGTVQNEIANAGDYARITSINDPDMGMVSTARGWYDHPMSITYNMDTCQNLEREFFPSK